MITAIIAFFLGAMFGKIAHLMSEERCPHLKPLHVTGYSSDNTHMVRCGLREEHTGPCRFRYTKNYHLFPTTEWHQNPDEVSQ